MRIAFLSPEDVSGEFPAFSREYFVYKSLCDCGHELTCISPRGDERNILQKVLGRLYRTIGVRYRPERNPNVLKRKARKIEREMEQSEFDIVFSLSSLDTAYLRTELPMVSWADAVFDCIVDFYPTHKRMHPCNIYHGHHSEERSLQRCEVSVLISNWAACRAARRYRFPLDRLRVVPRGACLPEVPKADEVLCRCTPKPGSLTAVLIGSDWERDGGWERKGGAIACEAVRILRDNGLAVRLVTIGMRPPEAYKESPGVQFLPILRKEKQYEWDRFRQALATSDVMLYPSRADFAPHSIAEAYAFGLPVISSAVGALPEVIDHGVTGYVVQRGFYAEEYADCLKALLLQPDLLADMRAAARAKFDRERTWEHIASKFSSIFEYVLYRRKARPPLP